MRKRKGREKEDTPSEQQAEARRLAAHRLWGLLLLNLIGPFSPTFTLPESEELMSRQLSPKALPGSSPSLAAFSVCAGALTRGTPYLDSSRQKSRLPTLDDTSKQKS